jgi:hypothetical protein
MYVLLIIYTNVDQNEILGIYRFRKMIQLINLSNKFFSYNDVKILQKRQNPNSKKAVFRIIVEK